MPGPGRYQPLHPASLPKTINSLTLPGRVAPSYLWNFLGLKKGEPFVPFPAQFDLLTRVHIPWPGVDPHTGKPAPTIYGINCGRRFSKTTSAEILLWHALMAPDDLFGPPCVRITADTFEHGRKIWDRFIWHLENTDLKVFLKKHDRSRFLVELTTGATCQLLSADNPQSLAGDGVTAWFIDEAQYLSYPAWENLFPSTAERDGVIVLFGVAEGEGPFREICYKGDNPADNPEYLRLNYPTSANPFVPRWRIELARRTYSPSRFKQLYEAEWDTDTGKIFTNVRGCINKSKPTQHPQGWGQVRPPVPGHVYYGGLDLALHADWCVYTIADRDGSLVAWDRFNRGSWELLKNRVFRLSQSYFHPHTFVDSTGSGDPIYEDLLRLGMNVEGFKFTGNEKKRQLIDECAIRIGAGTISYPEIPTMIRELERFESKKTASGTIQYSAPSGEHDDFVIALSLMCKALPRPMSAAFVSRLQYDPMMRREVAAHDSSLPVGFDPEDYLLDDEELALLASSGDLRPPDLDTLRQYSEADYIN